jgi:hypothetical protein
MTHIRCRVAPRVRGRREGAPATGSLETTRAVWLSPRRPGLLKGGLQRATSAALQPSSESS